ncbi:iron-containing alcohol dehydrogenase [Anaerotignum lactatifermentans]|uniref:Iron-containing alcohol dehydrogenase n=1 Tax=Anaerotignum lactatifermentans TaxID=160404 RepID=A0ABS2G709_9FIRM|nr:iron-containing alcohol dehydrogenase [Anaerotignum lactatifermentans]MBM6829138.1 iron-containing alcohol dehydrogenase [Anaerotignum lactatifermentans]MBM6877254.1 iron-containing alcohol dehydrogenase [Anaerotignum lactatifermentans]MBM6950627.1 iron-containing alcohol dehydrogenase [Anaerotignum lactatifermentans]
MKFEYYIPSRVLFGSGQLDRLHKQALPGKKALIVISCGTSVRKYGYLARLEEQLDMAGVGHVVFDKIQPNPTEHHVMEGAALAKAEGCDFVIGLGGGSIIDSAKAIAVMAVNDGEFWQYVSGGTGGGKAVPVHPLPIVAITTTAGTGTEADPWAVITNKNGEKIGFGYDGTFPVLSIVDPDLMMSVPEKLTAYQGFDALFHSTEGYINRYTNPINDLYALKAIELIGKSLVKAVNDGSDKEAREDVALANTLSGMSESIGGCTSEHAMEHPLSGVNPKLEHGAGLIMLCEEYYTYWAERGVVDDRMIAMAKALGKTDATKPMDFVDALHELKVACHVDDLKMSDYGIKEEDLEMYTKMAYDTMGGLFQVDPADMPFEDCLAIYKKAYK